VSLAGPRRSWEAGRERRPYRCRACGTTERDFYLPPGFLQVRVRDVQAAPGESTYAIAAVACSPACLVEIAQRWAARVADQAAGTTT
jgi:hypothetical protein